LHDVTIKISLLFKSSKISSIKTFSKHANCDTTVGRDSSESNVTDQMKFEQMSD